MACTKDYFTSGEQILSTELFAIDDFDKGNSLYEVVKILEGKPLFMDAHLSRLKRSAYLFQKEIPFSDKKTAELVEKLIARNGVNNGRLKFLFSYFGESVKFFSFFLKDITPPRESYKKGVKTAFYRAKRENPNIKKINSELRRKVRDFVSEKKVFEALLVSPNNIITEGSKSNFFGIKDNIVYTSPTKNILPGITRNYIFDICSRNNIPIVQKDILLSDIQSFQSAFISGTSIGVLPLSTIESNKFSTENKILRKIAGAYQNEIQKYLKHRIAEQQQ
ncbi:MAG: aminotransferase class IV [Bacteroidota bacterium]|nr:aminotransferase class IV [Bacteroidota bacterium]